jgi:tRNA(adenine34) deaminase
VGGLLARPRVRRPHLYDRAVNYELYMSAALAEARTAATAGERPDGAVAVMDDAMVARGGAQVAATGDPTAHAPMVVLREAARRLGRPDLSGLILFSVHEPCAMCVGALLEADADGIVFALEDSVAGACGSVYSLAAGGPGRRRLEVVSGIMRSAAREITAVGAGANRRPR